jgi:CheY-like chemotaxis protein
VGRPAIARILVVDDSITVAKFTEMILAAAGHKIIFAMDGIECMQKLRASASEIDLIILDVVMPGKNGFQLCREIKSSKEFGHLPVIMMTTKGQDADKFWGKRQGADAYLVKPCPEELLLGTVRQYVPEPVVEQAGPSLADLATAPSLVKTDTAALDIPPENVKEAENAPAETPSAPVSQTVECQAEELQAVECQAEERPVPPSEYFKKDTPGPAEPVRNTFYSFSDTVENQVVAEKQPETYQEEVPEPQTQPVQAAASEIPAPPKEEPKKKPLSLRERLQNSFYRFSN